LTSFGTPTFMAASLPGRLATGPVAGRFES
jgi:hypothetical protein